jgi:hypothetical protein
MIWTMMQVFSISKVQYVMLTQNLFMKFIQCDHITSNINCFESFSYIIHLYFVPWPMIDNPTSYDMIMYSTLIYFHP